MDWQTGLPAPWSFSCANGKPSFAVRCEGRWSAWSRTLTSRAGLHRRLRVLLINGGGGSGGPSLGQFSDGLSRDAEDMGGSKAREAETHGP